MILLQIVFVHKFSEKVGNNSTILLVSRVKQLYLHFDIV